MPKYEVTKAWHGVAVGQIVEVERLHPALASHVRPIKQEAHGTLTPATPAAAIPEPAAPRRGRPPKQQE